MGQPIGSAPPNAESRTATGTSLIVAACQLPEIHGNLRAALTLVTDYSSAAAASGARVVCFPECFLQGYDLNPAHIADTALESNGSALRGILEQLRMLEPVIVVGLLEREGESFYNTAIAIERGRVIARYRKAHLLRAEQAVFEPGIGATIFEVDAVKVGINICYDLNFGASIKRCASAGARVLLCPCNNMMARVRAEEWKAKHNEIRTQQAKDYGLWIVSSDVVGEREGRISYGPTAVIDPSGTVVAQVPLCEPGTVLREVA